MSSKDVSRHVERIVDSVSGNRRTENRDIPAPIRLSWERSLENYGIDPSKDEPVRILTANELREYTGPIDRFLRIAKVGMLHLYRQVADLGYSTLLCDANGITVDWRGNKRFAREWEDAGLYLGAVWNEHQEGTCGVGTALIEQIPLTVHRGEHFRAKNTTLTCSCAPIIDPGGQTMGLIDVSALSSLKSRDSQYLALQLVIQTARMIESAYFLDQFQDCWVLGLSRERELAEVSSECLIAIDGGGRILAADWVAVRTFKPETAGGSLVGSTVDQIFDFDFKTLLDLTHNSTLVLHAVTQKARLKFYTSLRGPHTVSPNHNKIISAETKLRNGRFRQPSYTFTLDRLAGLDPGLQKNVQRIKRVMNKLLPVLLCGETGTGKEMFARAIHRASQRADKPFVALNCAAIPESLIESELFGYKKGAFTGAHSKGIRGKILQADSGTLFLDEIGDMPASLQPRLLRVLAEREVTPLGGEISISVDLHVICATHRNLPALVASGEFRDDLYYRLNGISFELPPLRLRSDIKFLIEEILQIEMESDLEQILIDEEAMEILIGYSWPGNIRQLRNCLRYALAVCDNGVISVADLPVEIVDLPPVSTQITAATQLNITQPAIKTVLGDVENEIISGLNAREQAERRNILAALQKHRWRVLKAVDDVGLSRATIYRKMDKYHIIPPNKR